MKKFKIFFIILLLLTAVLSTKAQTKYFSKSGKISFYSKAPLEDIEAHNTRAVTVFDASTGQIEFSVLMKGFEFEKAKMQEHFNENYVESDKYPKAVFAGSIQNINDLTLNKDGVYTAKISGSLTLHGVSKQQNAQAVFTVAGGAVSAVSELTILVADYNIKIPGLVADKIGKSVKIVINVPAYQSMGSKS